MRNAKKQKPKRLHRQRTRRTQTKRTWNKNKKMLNHKKTPRRVRTPISEKNLLKDLEIEEKKHKIEIIHGYIHRKRLIPKYIYCKLKALRECQKCHKSIHYPPEIHHIIPKKLGGSNTIKNLIALCETCHLEEDKKNETITKK